MFYISWLYIGARDKGALHCKPTSWRKLSIPMLENIPCQTLGSYPAYELHFAWPNAEEIGFVTVISEYVKE